MDAKLQQNLNQFASRILMLHTRCAFIAARMMRTLKEGDLELFEALEMDYRHFVDELLEIENAYPEAVSEAEKFLTDIKNQLSMETPKKQILSDGTEIWIEKEVNLLMEETSYFLFCRLTDGTFKVKSFQSLVEAEERFAELERTGWVVKKEIISR